MLYCGISIDYLPQLERSGHREARGLIQGLRAMAASLGGSAGAKDQPLLLAFPEEGLFSRFLAAEAVRRVILQVKSLSRELRGASVGVHRALSAEAAYEAMGALRLVSGSRLCSITPEARAFLADYLPPPGADSLAWDNPLYDTMLADADLSALTLRRLMGSKLAEALSQDDARLVSLQSGPSLYSAAALAADLAKASGSAVVSLCGRKAQTRPFAPFTETFAPPIAPPERRKDRDEGDDATRESETAAALALESAYRLSASSLYAKSLPSALAQGCREYLERHLDGLGPTLVLCENADQFSPEATELVAGRLESGRGRERYLALSAAAVPEAWRRTRAIRLTMAETRDADMERAIEDSLGASVSPIRDRLQRRARALFDGSDSESGMLVALPRDAALLLYGSMAVQGLLVGAEIETFFAELGLPQEGSRILVSLLIRAGLLDPLTPYKALGNLPQSQVAVMAGKAQAQVLEERLDSFLVDKYRHASVRPSLGFLRRVGERPDDERLVLDCLFEEASGGEEPAKSEKGFLSASSASILGFWRALNARDRAQAEAAASRAAERLEGPRSGALKAMVRAELAYALGDGERAGISARESLLALGRNAPPRLEARAHRMMGLAALAGERYVEAVDYLTNAQELSETSGVEYERMLSAYARALAELMTGSLGKALRAASQAAESARNLFRVDAQAAVGFLLGRVDMELGAYDEATRRYQGLNAFCKSYGLEEAATRAMAWRGRAMAYAGSYDEACPVLERLADDPEARVFRGELEILRGRPRDARPWLDEPALPPARGFRPPDAFEWAGSLAEVEGRCLGFSSADGPLADMRRALSCFARGLDSRDPEAAIQLYELTRSQRAGTPNPGMGTYSFFCYLLEERLPQPPVDKQTVLSRAFKALQQRAGRIEDRAQRALFMEKNAWNRRLIEAAREHKFI